MLFNLSSIKVQEIRKKAITHTAAIEWANKFSANNAINKGNLLGAEKSIFPGY